MPRLRHDAMPRRGLSLSEAAVYVGVGTTLFAQMVEEGRMPKPKLINARKVWDLHQLDRAWENLPDQDAAAATQPRALDFQP